MKYLLATSSSQAGQDAARNKKQFWLNLFTALIIAATVLICFAQTVFQNRPISRVYQLGQRDTLYAKYWSPNREGYDASVYQYFVPNHHFLTGELRRGVLPLWNPLAGCGAPFFADVETAVSWPFRLLMLPLPPLKSWNLLIVANLLIFAIGSFLLSKALRLRRFAVIYASLLAAFCPYLVFQSELIGSSSSMIPLVMASFVKAHESPSIIWKILAGLACALMIVSGHPEPSFFGILCASMLYIYLVLFFESKDSISIPALLKRLAAGFGNIALIGLFAFGFSAFLLLPFFELLTHSDCYKAALSGHRNGVPLASIIINLFHPAYANSSPFLGVLLLPLVLFAFFTGAKQKQEALALACTALSAIAVMSQIGPLDLLMNSRAFSWFVPKYCWPSLLILLCQLSAFGFESLIALVQKHWRKAAIIAVVGSLITVLSLLAIRVFPDLLICERQDEAFEQMKVFTKFWTRDIIFLSIFGIAISASKLAGKAQAATVALTVAVLTVLSLAPITKIASPPSPALKYDSPAPIPFLQNQNARILTMGRHVFCPSSNFCYGINNLVPVNVYHPQRLQRFLIECGITPEGVNQFFDGRLSKLIDLAAVKYIVTPAAIMSQNEALPECLPLKSPDLPQWGEKRDLVLEAGSLILRSKNKEILGKLQFKAKSSRASKLALQLALIDEKNNVLWMSDIENLQNQFKTGTRTSVSQEAAAEYLKVEKDIAVPLTNEANKNLRICLQIFDWQNAAYLKCWVGPGYSEKLELAQCNLISESTSLASLKSAFLAQTSTTDASTRFVLKSETPSHIRVYENSSALAPACLRNKFEPAVDGESALETLKSEKFDPHNSMVLETGDLTKQALVDLDEAIKKEANQKELTFERPDSNTIKIQLNTDAASLLLLQENYYPGWQAKIIHNGQEERLSIMRANYLFQAVKIPAGESTVIFEFKPTSFFYGLLIALIATIASLGTIFYLRNKKNKLESR